MTTRLFMHSMRIRITNKVGEGREWAHNQRTNPQGWSMSARITRDDTSEPDEADITIRNLPPDDYGFLRDGRDLAVEVFAGVGDTVTRRFVGDVDASSVEEEREPPEQSVTLKAGALRDKHRFERSDIGYFQPNVSAAEMLSRICNNAGVELGILPPSLSSVRFPRGFQSRGPWRDVVRRICAASGVRPILSGDMLWIVAPGDALQEITPLLISGTLDRPGTGLVGEPKITADGVTFSALLMAGLEPGRKVQIDSGTFKGAVKIKRTDENLDTTDPNACVVECEGVAI